MARLDSSLESAGAEFLVLGHLLIAGIQAFKAYTNSPCVFHGFLPPSPSEGCHSVHGNAATQSTGCLPPSPRERCHVDHGKVATHARRSLPLSEQRDAGALLLV